MKKLSLSLFILVNVFWLHAQPPVTTGLFINEFMASNSSTYADVAGEYEDWVEIYNNNTAAVDLANYYLTDDLGNLTKQRFTAVAGKLVVPAKGFLIIWGGGNTSLGADHIDIGLSAGGEALALVAPNGTTIIDSYTFPAQKADVPMGRTINGAGQWAYLKPATPKASNNAATAYLGFLSPPSFSKVGGPFTGTFNLQLSTTETGASVIYTLDGSDPENAALNGISYRYKNNYQRLPSDPAGAFLTDSKKSFNYTQPIAVADRSSAANRSSMKSSTYDANPSAYTPLVKIKKATVVRARTVKAGYLPSDVVMHSYFPAGANGQSRYTLPVFSLGIPENYLFNWDSGIYNAGTDFEKWRKLKPSTTAGIVSNANYQRSSEFPISLEYFAGGSGQRLVAHNCGFRINGNGSRMFARKALRLYFKSEYGQSDIGYPVFPDQTTSNYKRLILRNGGNEPGSTRMTTTIRDMSLQAIVKKLKCDMQNGDPVIVYINGEYWGIHDLRERIDRVYFEMKYGIPEGQLDLMENTTADEGDDVHYKNMIAYIENNDLTQKAVYDSVQKLIDVDNMIDYQISEVFLDNTDWPNNNQNCYRKRVAYNPAVAGGADGRWRWILKDVDKGFSNSGGNDNLAKALSPNWGKATIVIRKLMTNPTFKQKFVTRYADLLNSFFLPANTNAVVNSFRQKVEPEIREHIERWRDPASYAVWTSNMTIMTTFANNRPKYARQHIQKNLTIQATQTLKIDVNSDVMGIVHVNTIDVDSTTPGIANHPYPWSSIYFQGVPVVLTPKAKTGYRFVRWQGDTTSTKDTLVLNLTKARSVVAVFEAIPVAQLEQIVHYWHFNNLPEGNLDNIAADSSVKGGALITYPGTGAGYLDRTNATEGSIINAQYTQPAGQAFRVRNPSDTRALIFAAPSTGFKNIKISYAAQRTGSGAQFQRLSYSTDGGTNWVVFRDSIAINEAFELQTFDLSAIAAVANNASLKIRIEFFGTNATGSSGNNRFDNFLITGLPVPLLNNKVEWYVKASPDHTGDGCVFSKHTAIPAEMRNASRSPYSPK